MIRHGTSADRGQLVLVAAAAIALALFPLVLAYLQLGYAGDVDAEPTTPAATAELDRALDRAVQAAAYDVDQAAPTTSMGAAEVFHVSLGADVRRLETATVESGVAAHVRPAAAPADDWVAAGRWQSGVAADFGEPTTHEGVVLQERAGQYVAIAIALEVSVVEPDRTVDRTMIIRIPG